MRLEGIPNLRTKIHLNAEASFSVSFLDWSLPNLNRYHFRFLHLLHWINNHLFIHHRSKEVSTFLRVFLLILLLFLLLFIIFHRLQLITTISTFIHNINICRSLLRCQKFHLLFLLRIIMQMFRINYFKSIPKLI